jgi:hypothetical protein
MSELLKKYESIDESKLNEGAKKILNRVKTITADFTTDDAKNNKIADEVLNEIMKKFPDSVKIVKRTPKAKTTPKKTHKATHTKKATHTTSSTAKSSNNIMSVAKEIQKAGESWKDAMERAKVVLKERKEQVVQKKRTELEKLYALVKTKKELQGFAKSDIQRDAVRTAKVTGKRFVTKEGTTSNQYGTFSNKIGRKYWETRDRHADRLAPNYPKNMPLLASGGGVGSKKYKKGDKITTEFGTYYVDGVDQELQDYIDKNKSMGLDYVLAEKKVNIVYSKYFNEDNEVTATLRSWFNDKKQPTEKGVRDAMIWSYDSYMDYQIKAGGGSKSDSEFSSMMRIAIADANGNDKDVAILKKYSTDFKDVLITIKEIQALEEVLETKGAKDKKSKDKLFASIDFLFRADLIGSVNDINGKPVSKETLNKIFNNVVKEYSKNEINSAFERKINAIKMSLRDIYMGETEEQKEERLSKANKKLAILENLQDRFNSEKYADGGSVSNLIRMYNFLKDDLVQLEEAIKSGDFEEVNRFFSYWLGSSGHLKSLQTMNNQRMYMFLQEDLNRLMLAVENNDNEEIERFFSYWLGSSGHLVSIIGSDIIGLVQSETAKIWKKNNPTLTAGVPPENFEKNWRKTQDEAIEKLKNEGKLPEDLKFEDIGFMSKNFEKGGIFYKEGSNKYGLGNTEIFVQEENDMYCVYDNVYNDENENWEIKKLADFDTMDEAKEFAIEYSKKEYANGGSLPFMTDPNFGNFQNTGAFAKGGGLTVYKIQQKFKYDLQPKWEDEKFQTGGRKFITFAQAQDFKKKLQDLSSSMEYKVVKVGEDEKLANGGSIGDLTEQEFLKKYFGANVFTENPSQFFEIKKLSSSDDNKVDTFVKELKADGFTVKKRAFSDFTSVMGVKKKASFANGGSVQDDLKKRMSWADNKAKATGDVYLVLQHKKDKSEIVGIKKEDYTNGITDYKDWNVVYFTEKEKFELGGAFVMTDLAGHTGGSDGLGNPMPLSGTSGTYYTGLVGETGAMSSGELFENGGGIEKTTKVEDIKNSMYKAFQSFLDGKISDEKLVSTLNRVLGKRKWFRFYDGDTLASDPRSVESSLSSRINRESVKEDMQLSLDTKGLQIYNWDGDEIFEAGGAMMANQQVIDDASQPYVITEAFGNPAQHLASGGSLGKSLYVEYSSYFDYNKYDTDKIISALESVGAKNIRLENDRGWSNQPEVVVFNGSKNQAVDALNEAFDTDYIRVSEKDWRTKKMADGGSVGDDFEEVIDLGTEQYYTRPFGEVGTDSRGDVELVVVATIRDLEDYIPEEDLPEEGNFQLDITLVPTEEFISEEILENANDEDSSSISDDSAVNVVNYAGGLNYSPQTKVHFESQQDALDYLMSKELKNKINSDAMLAGFVMDRRYNRAGQDNWGYLDYLMGVTDRFAKGGFVGRVEFNAGDIVWQKDEKRYAFVMNNYGDPINGSSGEIRLDTTGNTPIFTYNKDFTKETGYNLVKLGEKGDTGKFTPEVLAEMKEQGKKYLDFEKRTKGNIAYIEKVVRRTLDGEFDSMVGRAKATASNKKGSSDYTYVPNKDVKELSVVVKGELKKLMGSDILDGVYVKNSAKSTAKSTAKVDSNAVFAKILKDAKEAKRGKSKRYDASDLKKLNLEIVKKLIDAGYTEQQVRNIIFGYTFDNEVVADGEFEYENGIFAYEPTYVESKINSLVEAKKKNEFVLGIEYPNFDWKSIIKKYKVSTKPKELSYKRNLSDGSYYEYFYQVFVGEKIAFGHNLGYKRVDKNGKVEDDYVEKGKVITDLNKLTEWQKERDYSAGFNAGYWYVVSSKIETIDDILKTLLSQKEGYCKELDFYADSFSETLKENKIAFADGGAIGSGKNGYVAFYKGKRIEVYADTMYEAQKTASQHFKARKDYDVNVVLAEIDGKPYINSTMFADGGGIQRNNIDAELEDFDLDNLDPFETMQYNQFVKSSGKVGALQILINTVEGDYTQLSPELAELAEMQMSTEEYDEATRQMRFERDGYAKGGVMAKGGKLESGVYRVGKPTKVSSNLYEQKIVEIFDNGDISTASDYGRKLSDFKSQKYPIITKEQLDNQYKMADGGSTGSGFDPVKVKVVLAVGIDSAIEFYNADYPIRPYQLLERGIRGGYMTLDEINERVVDSAMETAQDSEDMEEVGSSDFGAFMYNFLDEAGFKVGRVNGRLTREYADGGSFAPNVADGTAFMDNAYFADGGMFDDNDGFMKADNNRNFRYPEMEVYVETIDEPIDLTSNVSSNTNNVVIRPLDQNIDLNEDGRIRAKMSYNPVGRTPEKMMAVNQRMVVTDLPMPTSHTHKND